MISTLLSLTIWLITALSVSAQGFTLQQGMSRPLDVDAAFDLTVEGARLSWEIAPGYYLYRDHITVKTADGQPLELHTPPGDRKDDPNFGEVEVYHDRVDAEVVGSSQEVIVTYQGCQEDGICYPPISKTVEIQGTALGGDGSDAPTIQLSQSTGMVEGLAVRGGVALVLAGFFGFGLLLAFTPCVFPMLPILVGLLSRSGERLPASRSLSLASAYVIAMAVAFGAMGAVAGWSGRSLQMILQAPATIAVVSMLFVFLALSSFGMFELRVPNAVTQRLGGVGGGRRGSLGGAALLGFTSALIVGPCVTAPLAGALLYIAQTADVTLGAAALFALGLGQGVPLLIIAVLGTRILPKAGSWMEIARYTFGFLFLAMAVWLLGRVIPGFVLLGLWSALLIAVAIFVGALNQIPSGASAGLRLAKTAGVVLLLWGGLLAVGAAMGGNDPLRPLASLKETEAAVAPDQFAKANDVEALDRALAATDRPALVYVTAEWCVTCRSIERDVLADPGVAEELNGFAAIKTDVTELDDRSQALLSKLGVAGPPTMIFLNAQRREPEGSRLIGEIDVEDFMRSAAAAGDF